MRTKTDYPQRAASLRLALRMAEEAQLIGGRIRERRKELGLSQRALAERLPGKTEGKDVSRWENGHHRPSPNTLAEIAKALGTTVSDLHSGAMAERPELADTDLMGKFNGNEAELLQRVFEVLGRLSATVDGLVDEVQELKRRLPGSGEASDEPQPPPPS